MRSRSEESERFVHFSFQVSHRCAGHHLHHPSCRSVRGLKVPASIRTHYGYNLFNGADLFAICFVRINRSKGNPFERCRRRPQRNWRRSLSHKNGCESERNGSYGVNARVKPRRDQKCPRKNSTTFSRIPCCGAPDLEGCRRWRRPPSQMNLETHS
jgi:hypothetical protein